MAAPSPGDWATVPFRKSTRSSTNGGQCVEVGARSALVAVRDSKSPDGGLVEMSTRTWARFRAGLRA